MKETSARGDGGGTGETAHAWTAELMMAAINRCVRRTRAEYHGSLLRARLGASGARNAGLGSTLQCFIWKKNERQLCLWSPKHKTDGVPSRGWLFQEICLGLGWFRGQAHKEWMGLGNVKQAVNPLYADPPTWQSAQAALLSLQRHVVPFCGWCS